MQPTATAPFCARRPAALGERQLQRFLGTLDKRRAASLRFAASSGEAVKQLKAMAPLRAHCPAALGERQRQLLLGALHERTAFSLRAAAFRWPSFIEAQPRGDAHNKAPSP